MPISFFTFIVSGSVLILFVLVKLLQQRFSILLFWPGFRERMEISLRERKVRTRSYFEKYTTKNFYIFLHYCIGKLKMLLVRIHEWLDKKSHHMVSRVRGRQKVEMNKKSSHFLRDITPFKNRFKGE